MNRTMLRLFVLAVLATVPFKVDAAVTCDLYSPGEPEGYECTESRQGGLLKYSWEIIPPNLANFQPTGVPNISCNLKRVVVCNRFDPQSIVDLDGNVEGTSPYTKAGRVKVVVQLGVNTGPLSQWVSEANIRRSSKPGTGGMYACEPAPVGWGNNHFVFCHRPRCALWDMRASGGAGANIFHIRRSFSSTGTFATIQTETSVYYFNVDGSDSNLWWKVCAVNGHGETCSGAFRTRAECRDSDDDIQPY